MSDLAKLTFSEMTLVAAKLRKVGRGAASMEVASQQVARFFYEEFVEHAGGHSAFVLARCFKTHPLGLLPPELQSIARKAAPNQSAGPDTQCLTLLGTYGDEPQWQSRRQSISRQVVPLVDEEALARLPMIDGFMAALGLERRFVVSPDPAALALREREGFGVFHVENALGSPWIPAQDAFVKPHGVASAVGFGFVTPPANLFEVILFSRQAISLATAQLFRTLALSLKLVYLPLGGRVFEEGGA
jgi:hypothetical protein